ncbi:MAG: hypothetical protein RL753_16 [Bacteroidota bacterium]|jgi:hypothetical protein
MPLPSVQFHGAKRCHAKSKRSGLQCLNPAAYGMPVCRFHGARRPETILRGASHPLYVHGQETTEARTARREALVRIRNLMQVMYSLGIAHRHSPGKNRR